MIFSITLRDEYHSLFQSCTVNPKRKNEVDSAIALIMRGAARYTTVGTPLKIPWYFIALLHLMECNCSFQKHLHNGDPLHSKTRHVPARRPPGVWPTPCATDDVLWTTSATDALKFEGFERWTDWSIEGLCYSIEKNNGWGYRAHHENDPYLWAGSDHAQAGKYTSDGHFDAKVVSDQIGAAVILRSMVDQQLVKV